MSKEEGRLNAIKEELEEMIEQIKSEVDKKDQDMAHFKKRQDESFDMISFKMEKLKEDFKTFGKYCFLEQTVDSNFFFFSKFRQKWRTWKVSRET